MTTKPESKEMSCGQLPAHDYLKCYCKLAKTPGELVKMISAFGINTKFNSLVALQMSNDDSEFKEGVMVNYGFDIANGFGKKFNLFMYDDVECYKGDIYYGEPICPHPLKYVTVFSGHAQQLALRIRPETDKYDENIEGFRHVVEFDLIVCRACKCACVVYRVDTTINEDWDEDEGDLNFIPEQMVTHARKVGKYKEEKFQAWLKNPNPQTYKEAEDSPDPTPPPSNSPMEVSECVEDKPQNPEAKL